MIYNREYFTSNFKQFFIISFQPLAVSSLNNQLINQSIIIVKKILNIDLKPFNFVLHEIKNGFRLFIIF